MAFFPFFIDIQNKKCTLIGGGTVAARKAEALLPFGCHITVIAPQFCHELRQMEGLQLIQRCFEPKDLENSFFVIAATNNSAVNAQISNFLPQEPHLGQRCGRNGGMLLYFSLPI